jgi:hypothetical protein
MLGEGGMNDSLDAGLTVEPFGFFTKDAFRAGWYLLWRQLVRVVPAGIGALLLGSALGMLGLALIGVIVMGLGLGAAGIWALLLVPRLASQWAVATYGYPLTGAGRVWWGITWRAVVASLVAAVIFTPPNFVAMSLSTAFPDSALGALGGLLTVLLGLVNFVVSILATGWAMSRVAAEQLSGLPLAPVPLEPAPSGATPMPVAVAEPLGVATAPSVSTLPPPVRLAPAAPAVVVAPQTAGVPARAEGKPQCPKCGLYETERGTVIGWYCTICGWRESAARGRVKR